MARKERPAKGTPRRAPRGGSRSRQPDPAPPSHAPIHHPPIVGIGASAGGLDAFTRLLKSLPAKTGMAYVVVQHLDPAHESILPELLGRATAVPVRQVKDGMRVAADHVYVIPPNTTMTMEDGTLRLTTRPKTRGPHMPIDDFLRSLAAIHRSNAIAVVLSGTGSDGALGIEAIKAEGGITMAQDSASAFYSSMPESAAATGHVDFILPPEEIASQLDRIARHVVSHPMPDETGTDGADDVDRILGLLRTRTGVDFRLYRRGTIQRRILRRMLLHRQDTKKGYLAHLRTNPGELDALYDDLLIGVTSFFRDPAAFDALQRTAFPEIMSHRRGDAPIRLWAAGCAGGEETYSLAMSLLEFLGERANNVTIQIFGTDLSETAIARARAGRYPQGIEAHVSAERLRRFFVKDDDGYRILKSVRDLCVFARQNVVSDPPFSQLDLISCRNVLIYLEPALQRRVFPIFHYALKPHGMLMLGTAESAGPTSGYFIPVDKKQRIYRRGLARAEPLNLETYPRHMRAEHAPRAAMRSSAGDVQTAADRVVLARYAPSGVVVNDRMEIVQFRGDTGDFLTHPPGLASLDLLRLVRPELVAPLRTTLRRARQDGQPARQAGIAVGDGGKHVALEVVPFSTAESSDSSTRFFAVFVHEEGGDATPSVVTAPKSRRPRRRPGSSRSETLDARSLRDQLDATKRHLQEVTEDHEAANEELRAANEEIQSSNEELQSTNEELETTKEEIQSTNEELTTLNEELRHRNQELATISADLANVLSSTHVPVLIVGNDLRIRRFTPAVERVLKVIPSDVGRPLSDVRRRIDVPDLEQRILRASETLEATEQELQDDDGRWWSMVIRPYRTADRQIDGAVIVFGDIDATKRHERAMADARIYAEGIVETIREPLVVLDAELRVQSANRSFHNIFGSTPATVQGRSLFSLGNGEWDSRPVRTMLERVVSMTVAVQDVEFAREFPRIGYRTLLLNARPLDFGDGRPSLVLLAIEDATARKRTEEAQRFLADAGARLGKSLDMSETLGAITDLVVPRLADHCVIHLVARDGALHLAREARARSEQASVPARDVASAELIHEPALRRAMTGGALELLGGPDDQHQIGARADSGQALPPVMVVPLVLRGRPVGTLTLVAGDGARTLGADLVLVEEFATRAALALDNAGLLAEARAAHAEAEAARAAAETANRAKTDFLTTMSHELRTPLNAILGYVQLLEMELRGPITDAQRTDLHRIALTEQHLSNVIGQILDFAKINSGQLAYETTDVPLSETIGRVILIMQAPMEGKGLRFVYEPCDPGLTAWGDAEKIERILLNLLSNALKFTPRGGSVTVTCDADDNTVSIRVRDTGRGIASDMLDVVFEPFVQLEKRASPTAGGTGLGLAISRDLARAMEGEVQVSSAMGEGSTFTLTLPRRAPSARS